MVRGAAMVTQGRQRYDENEQEWELTELRSDGGQQIFVSVGARREE